MRYPIPDLLRLAMLAWVVLPTALAANAPEQEPAGTVELSPLPLDRSMAVPPPVLLGLGSPVLTEDTLGFVGGYHAGDWSGEFKAMTLNADGGLSAVAWDAGALLTHATSSSARIVLSARRDAPGRTSGMAFAPMAPFDDREKHALMSPEPASAADTLEARVAYLRGARVLEQDGLMRPRKSLLGAIVHAQPVLIGPSAANYRDAWPSHIHGVPVPAPEAEQGAQSYAAFKAQNIHRVPFAYMAANDGMLHAFHAPAPMCKETSAEGHCKANASEPDAGREAWAFVPRAAYGNLANLTRAWGFQFHPSVDATPATRDVFFSQRGRHEWHTLLVGGLGLGGRGVYALDVTEPTAASEAFPERIVLWEFDADAPPATSLAGTPYDPSDLGYTYGQAAIARLANGRWAALVPSGYFADCRKPDKPARCEEENAGAPKHGALFVLDAQTGEVIAELRTPEGVSGFGLTTPVLGDYDNDQIDDVAFAGDLVGNLWRFDLSAADPAEWSVSLAYQPEVPGAQPITVMPRLFPDPASGRFMVVFGTGRYLGEGDKSDASMQSIYGIRDSLDAAGKPATATRASLQAQVLSEETVTTPSGIAVVRKLTSEPLPPSAGGWRIDLDVAKGERVVVTPTARFDTNVVLVDTLIPAGDRPRGAVLAIDAATGGARNIVAFGGGSQTGVLLEAARTTGTLPMAMRIGGGALLAPGMTLQGNQGDAIAPLSFDAPLWRRRSWSLLTPGT